MKAIDRLLADIPFSEVTLRTNLSTYGIIERIRFGVQPTFIRNRSTGYFVFEGSADMNYFTIRSHLRNADGKDAFSHNFFIGISFVGFPIRIETSPIFFGRVIDEEGGAVIKGHFALPFPILMLILALFIIVIGMIYPQWLKVAEGLIMICVMWSISVSLNSWSKGKGS